MKAVVVFSGGQDSTTCLALANHRYGPERVLPLMFDYGQKHRVELEQALVILRKTGQLEHAQLINLHGIFSNYQSSALLDHDKAIGGEHPYLKDRPASFVPARNALFLTVAYGLAMEAGARYIYTGVSQTDYSGYPDCRDKFIRQLNCALNVGYEREIDIITPLMRMTKAQTFALADELGALSMVVEDSHTCYNGDRTPHRWGAGCGTCPACKLRAEGWAEFSKGWV